MSVVTFIINPTSGTGKSKKIPLLIHSYFSRTGNSYRIRFTEYAGHAKVIVNEEIANGARTIVAVGGDGTVNEVASGLLHSEAALGIVPTGSGNGLARHLNIPMKAKKALQVIAEGNAISIDSGEVNGQAFFCTAGIGFDATVAERFSSIKGRGLINYIKASLNEYQRFTFEKATDKNNHVYQGFLLSICNANQYGNNAFICPKAQINDGQLNLVEVAPLTLWQLPIFLFQLLNKRLSQNKFYVHHPFSSMTLKRMKPGPLHIDGDPVEHVAEITIRCVPKSLNIIIPASQ
ncbi:MAG TPA: diacylglycerol kinase family protein [Cytophagaceae bacterium]|nr:diacylglycerol kinase family protein [Cytophagaceae bacterium]